jgi:hypothetical protein
MMEKCRHLQTPETVHSMPSPTTHRRAGHQNRRSHESGSVSPQVTKPEHPRFCPLTDISFNFTEISIPCCLARTARRFLRLEDNNIAHTSCPVWEGSGAWALLGND